MAALDREFQHPARARTMQEYSRLSWILKTETMSLHFSVDLSLPSADKTSILGDSLDT